MSSDLDPAALRCFAQAVRMGSMGRAAVALGRTQPAISQQIRRLEDILGYRLVRRTTQGVLTTAEGEAFLPLAERILALNEEAYAHVHRRAATSIGRRRIGIIEDVAANGLQRVFADFSEAYPQIELDVVVCDSTSMRGPFRDGKLDLVLADTLLLDASPRMRRSCPTVWCAAPSFDQAAYDPLPLVLYQHPCEWRVRTVQSLDQFGRRWRTAFESGSLIAIQAAVRAGVGVATLLPGNVGAGLTALDIKASRLPEPPKIEIALYRRPGLRGDPATAALEDLLWKAVS